MTDRARELEREPKSGSGVIRPATYRVSAGQSVERAIPFDCVEDAAVLRQKIARLGVGREEGTNPRGTRPNRTSQRQSGASVHFGIKSGIVAQHSVHFPLHAATKC